MKVAWTLTGSLAANSLGPTVVEAMFGREYSAVQCDARFLLANPEVCSSPSVPPKGSAPLTIVVGVAAAGSTATFDVKMQFVDYRINTITDDEHPAGLQSRGPTMFQLFKPST